jgi:hypothetical protein
MNIFQLLVVCYFFPSSKDASNYVKLGLLYQTSYMLHMCSYNVLVHIGRVKFDFFEKEFCRLAS